MSETPPRCRQGVALARNLSAALVILAVVGGVLLSLESTAAPGGAETGFQAFFTSVSAVCGCSLTIADPATRLNLPGKVVLALLIQAGGVIYALVGVNIAARVLAGLDMAGESNGRVAQRRPWSNPRTLVLTVLLGAAGLELLGALAMLPWWHAPMSFADRAGLSLFHAISAFCNSGMSVLPEGLQGYRYSPLAHLVVVPLLILGGLGFPALLELRECCLDQFRGGRNRAAGKPTAGSTAPMPVGAQDSKRGLSRGVRWIIAGSAALYLAGVIGVGGAQLIPRFYQALKLGNQPHEPTYGPLSATSLGAMLADASFLSISSRTGGFSTMPTDELRTGARFALTPLMAIGAGLGGTAGGMGVLVLAIIVISTRRSGDSSGAVQPPIPPALVRAALMIALSYMFIYLLGVYALCLSEPYPFLKLAFEASSALGNCGLSMGITGDLTTFGQWVILAMMFLGRTAPLMMLGMAVEEEGT